MHRDGCCTVEVTSPSPAGRHLTLACQLTRRVWTRLRNWPKPVAYTSTNSFRRCGNDLIEQDKVRITLKFNFVRFPTSLGSINIHASLESPYARLYPLP